MGLFKLDALVASWQRKNDEAKFLKAQKAGEQLGVRSWVVARQDVSLGASLGKGAFGVVHACSVKGFVESAVAKRVDLRLLKPEDATLLQNEVKIWSQLDHPACVAFLGVCIEQQEYLLLCEFCEAGALSAYHSEALKRRQPFLGLLALADQMRQVGSGLAHLHAKKLLHRDLKSSNILISNQQQLKIGDFGLACSLPRPGHRLTPETGSYRWMAPEVIRHERYDQSADVYSFAILAWEMMNYQMPYADMTPVEAAFAVADRDLRPGLPPHCPDSIGQLLRASWHSSPRLRPSFKEIVSQLDHLVKTSTVKDYMMPAVAPPQGGASSSSSGGRAASSSTHVRHAPRGGAGPNGGKGAARSVAAAAANDANAAASAHAAAGSAGLAISGELRLNFGDKEGRGSSPLSPRSPASPTSPNGKAKSDFGLSWSNHTTSPKRKRWAEGDGNEECNTSSSSAAPAAAPSGTGTTLRRNGSSRQRLDKLGEFVSGRANEYELALPLSSELGMGLKRPKSISSGLHEMLRVM